MTAGTMDPATPAWAADLRDSATALRASIDALEDTVLRAMKRRDAIIANYHRGSGIGAYYDEVPFLDGRLPTQPAPSGPGLPPIPYFAALWNPDLTGQHLTTYLHGHGITSIPEEVEDRRFLLARVLGVRFKDPSRASLESTSSFVSRTY